MPSSGGDGTAARNKVKFITILRIAAGDEVKQRRRRFMGLEFVGFCDLNSILVGLDGAGGIKRFG